MKVMKSIVAVVVAACTVLLLLMTKCEGQVVVHGLNRQVKEALGNVYDRCSRGSGFIANVQGKCRSVIRKGRNSSYVGRCCRLLREGGNTCSCIMSVSAPKKTQIIRSLIQNKVIKDVCGFNNQTVESMLNCTSFNQTLQRIASGAPRDCPKSLEDTKDNCASIVAQAKANSGISYNLYDLKTRACCAEMSTYSFSTCVCLAITDNAKVGATNDTVDFFKFATTNKAISNRCATPLLKMHCKVLNKGITDVDLCKNQYGDACKKTIN